MANDESREQQLTEPPRSRGTVRASAPRLEGVQPSAALALSRCALFLDVDGTLIDIAARPADVAGDAELLQLLRALRACCQGALALISGRSIADLDRITAPERFTAAGLHGFERRNAHGDCVRRAMPSTQRIAEVRRVLMRLASHYPQLLLEDKTYAIAIHYRQAPHLREVVESAIHGLQDLQGHGLRVQPGCMVMEVTPSDASKATALADFMTEPPFTGRLPVYLGDDATDESAFQWVNASSGLSIDVGRRQPSSARAHLASVTAVRSWLRALTEGAK